MWLLESLKSHVACVICLLDGAVLGLACKRHTAEDDAGEGGGNHCEEP